LHWLDRYAAELGQPLASLCELSGPGFSGRATARDIPTLVVRNVHKFSRGRQEQRLLTAARPGVYDLDDGLPWDDGRLPGLGRWWKRPWPRALIAARAATAADRVVVGNEVLADWASTRCADVRIVPTCVEPDSYARKVDHRVATTPLLGWVGSPATEHYLVSIAPALAEVHRRTGARVVMISGPGEVPAALSAFTDRIVWSEAVVAGAIAGWDVGLMPLTDGVYERAKCGYKLLQYGAAALPVVGSPVGVNRRLLRDMDGDAPTTIDEWVDSLVAQLHEPVERRAERGAAARRVAEAHSYDVWEARWRDAVGLSSGASS
jgi:glycosyltransferase involved in cell wall biosynthesis